MKLDAARTLIAEVFERMGWPNNGTKEGAQQYFDWFKFQFWRFVFVQEVVGKELQTFLEYPPMQRGASFNLDAVKAEMTKRMQQAEAAYTAALAGAAPGLAVLDAQIAQARETLMDLQMQRQRMVRAADRAIADVTNARDAARDTYMQASRAQMTARQTAIAAQRAATPQ